MVQSLCRLGVALSFVAIGVSHFTDPDVFVGIMPPYLPWHLQLVYLSGLFEILGGLGLFVPLTRRFAGYGLLALLIAVFPANVHMAINQVYLEGMPQEQWLLWLRLPLQLLFAAAVLWSAELWPPWASSSVSPASPAHTDE